MLKKTIPKISLHNKVARRMNHAICEKFDACSLILNCLNPFEVKQWNSSKFV